MKNFSLNTFTVLGIFLGATSVASLVEKYFDVGLAPIAGQILEYYGGYMELVRSWGFDWWTTRYFDLEVPMWTMDIVMIWGLCIAGNFRVYSLQMKHLSDLRRIGNSLDQRLTLETFGDHIQLLRYVVVSQVVLAPIDFATRPFRRFWRLALIGARIDRTKGPSYKVLISTLLFELRLAVFQFSPFALALAFFVQNATQIAT
jgi:hypothetical protein